MRYNNNNNNNNIYIYTNSGGGHTLHPSPPLKIILKTQRLDTSGKKTETQTGLGVGLQWKVVIV